MRGHWVKQRVVCDGRPPSAAACNAPTARGLNRVLNLNPLLTADPRGPVLLEDELEVALDQTALRTPLASA